MRLKTQGGRHWLACNTVLKYIFYRGPVVTGLTADLGEREAGCRSSCRADSSLRSSDTRTATASPAGLR